MRRAFHEGHSKRALQENAMVHFHCWVIDGVFPKGADGQVHFAGAAALKPDDLAAVQLQARAVGCCVDSPPGLPC
jgi:hypothetical protein